MSNKDKAKLEAKQRIKVILISDGTGETGRHTLRAAMAQFPSKDIYLTRHKEVITKDQVDRILKDASLNYDLVSHTVVSPELRTHINESCKKNRIRCVDLMGDLLLNLSNIFEAEPSNQPGLLHRVNEQYFKRVEAIEYTLNHDDGRNLSSLDSADVVLVGLSRSSKTPLSIYLSLEGYRVVNIPVILGVPLPQELSQIDSKRIFGLIIDPEALHRIRKNRLERLGFNDKPADYADMSKVLEEVEWVNNIFNQNKRWPIINVTEKAVEETASEIIKILNMRKSNRFL